MSSKIRSFWLALWAGFLRLFSPETPTRVTPTTISQKEKPMDRNDAFVFIQSLRALGNRDSYKILVDAAQSHYQPMSTQDWTNLLHTVDAAVRRGSPGHDFGHTRRDFLDALAIATDKKVGEYLPAEVLAGLIAGMLHDLGVGYVARYKDAETLLGHAEEGAWRFFTLTERLLEENLRFLIAYAIASHTHYLKALACKDGSVREPWYYELFEAEGHKYGWAVLACRFADRLDTNGATLMLRHFLANADSVEGGQDLSGDTFYNINHASIRIMVTPKKAMIEMPDGKKAPTTLQHIANFAGSNFGNSPYSRDDHLFPTMTRLMGYKVSQTMTIALTHPVTFWEKASIKLGLDFPIQDLHDLLLRSSRSPRFDEAWAVLETAFSELSLEELAIWSQIISYLNDAYDKTLEVLKSTIIDNESEYTKPVAPLLDAIIAEISEMS